VDTPLGPITLSPTFRIRTRSDFDLIGLNVDEAREDQGGGNDEYADPDQQPREILHHILRHDGPPWLFPSELPLVLQRR
jgi:hypothetical protein